MLRKVTRAWGRVLRKGRELGPRSVGASESYLRWVEIRVKEVKLPFLLVVTVESEAIPKRIPVLDEDIEKLKDALSKYEQEKAELQDRMEKMLQEIKSLQRENVIKEERISECNERASIDEKKIPDIQECLRGANDELKVRNQDRNWAIDKAYVWRTKLDKSLAVEKDLRGQLADMRSQLEGLVAEYEGKLVTERDARKIIREKLEECQVALQKEYKTTNELKAFADYQEKIYGELEKGNAYLKEGYIKLNDQCVYLEDRFSRLAGLANDAIMEIPERMKMADAVMTRENTPIEVVRFVEFCKCLIVILKIRARWPEDKKRKRG